MSNNNANIVRIIYVLYLVGLVTGGLTAIPGVVMALLYAGDASYPLRDHYRFQYRTFFMGLLYSVIAGITTVAFIGWLLMLVVIVWWIVRCARGLKALEGDMPPRNVDTWGF